MCHLSSPGPYGASRGPAACSGGRPRRGPDRPPRGDRRPALVPDPKRHAPDGRAMARCGMRSKGSGWLLPAAAAGVSFRPAPPADSPEPGEEAPIGLARRLEEGAAAQGGEAVQPRAAAGAKTRGMEGKPARRRYSFTAGDGKMASQITCLPTVVGLRAWEAGRRRSWQRCAAAPLRGGLPGTHSARGSRRGRRTQARGETPPRKLLPSPTGGRGA